MRMRAIICAAVACVVALPAAAKTKEPTLQDKQQAACFDDVQRLCGNFVPNVDQVTACMSDKRPQVSPKCASMYDAKQ